MSSAAELPPRALVMACGNPLRGDDAVAWHAADRLGDVLASEIAAGQVEVIVSHQWLPEWAEMLSTVGVVLFIDAAVVGDNDTVTVRPVAATSPTNTQSAFSHHVTPGSLLWMAENLFGATPQAWALTVRAEQFEIGASLSQTVAAQLQELVAESSSIIRSFLNSASPVLRTGTAGAEAIHA